MMATKNYVNKSHTLKIDASQLKDLGDRLGRVNKDGAASLILDTVNSVADTAYQAARRDTLNMFNMKSGRFDEKFSKVHATRSKPDAQVIAQYGGEGLSHYDAEQRARRAVSPIYRLKGDVTRGIALGDRQHAVSIEVRKGNRRNIATENVFMATGRNGQRDSEGNLFIFQRIGGRTKSGKTKLRRLFGPSPHQLFGRWIPKNNEALNDEMRDELIDRIDEWLDKEVFT